MIFKNNELKRFAELLKKNGYKVYVYAESDTKTYFFYVKDDKIGYAQAGDFGHGVHISTIHKPCKECGTGYRMTEDPIDNPTLNDAEMGFAYAPRWANPKDVSSIKKYKDWAEYTESRTILTYTEFN